MDIEDLLDSFNNLTPIKKYSIQKCTLIFTYNSIMNGT